MNTFKRIITTGLAFFFLVAVSSCNSGTEGQESDAVPAESGLSERYNINAPDEELLNVDSADADSSIEDSLTDTAQ